MSNMPSTIASLKRLQMKLNQRYPYQRFRNPKGTWDLWHDRYLVLEGATEAQCWDWLHAHTSYSVSHALDYEGYAMLPAGTVVKHHPKIWKES